MKTNADRIREMDNQELADYLKAIFLAGKWSAMITSVEEEVDLPSWLKEEETEEVDLSSWLKEEVEEVSDQL